MTSRFIPLIALLCLAPFLHAQTQEPPAHYQVYGEYSYLSNSINGLPGSHQALNGFDAGIAFPSWRNLRFKIDVTGYTGTNLGATQHPYFIMGGGQYNWRLGRETVFAEALVGDGGINRYWGPKAVPGETASFVAFTGGGLDTRMARHLAFRMESGYQYSYFQLINNLHDLLPYELPGLPTNFWRLSSGLVVEF
jgi:hypothetical protein